ncbi:MAG: RCC1 domain-containing protein [Acidimicrobiaceae bacterium]|nr:RCC1 domain-containing protein [Acidimicrobiaceae bacterium]
MTHALHVTPPDGEFTSVSAEELYSCAVRTSGELACWGYEAPWWRGEVIPDDLVEVSVASAFACGIVSETGGIQCWGRRPMGLMGGEVLAIAPGDVNVCAVLSDLAIDCSYDMYRGSPPDFPKGDYQAISSGGAYFCAVAADGAIRCWEDDEGPGARFDITSTPIGEFTSVAAGPTHACALRSSGTAACWGSNDHGQAEPPEIGFVTIDVTDGYSCGVRHDGGIECWGAPLVDPSGIPQGSYVDVSAAPGHACALGAGGTVDCWFTHFVPRPEGVEWVWDRPNS